MLNLFLKFWKLNYFLLGFLVRDKYLEFNNKKVLCN